ncbi:MAG: HAMP domain-containing histidine kinase [Selenomonadaceae bacterium]|nr:HAMP domain-containing histidine kinase [Selenomonadaceae bacterium]MBQ3726808.1 HAMP domain-containing histidine kinase [Selenomonadaceae bacterium]MBQ9497869.1 HAMP domain-containing histidine kinase [Selenomonadaceae bacterium]
MRLGIKASKNFLRQQRFVNDVSHELRTPLTIIRGYVDLLETCGATDPELFKEAVSSIKKSAQNMQSLVESLLFLARADQGHQPLAMVPVDLDELLKKFVEDYRSPRVQLTKLMPCKILADAEFMKKMLAAFLDNALRYSPPDSSVKVELTAGEDVATLKFIDKGVGIPKEDYEKIFDRFYRADKARTRLDDEESSVGLGLSVAKWIADRHDIVIKVKSRLGEGTTFTLTIPTIQIKSQEPGFRI